MPKPPCRSLRTTRMWACLHISVRQSDRAFIRFYLLVRAPNGQWGDKRRQARPFCHIFGLLQILWIVISLRSAWIMWSLESSPLPRTEAARTTASPDRGSLAEPSRLLHESPHLVQPPWHVLRITEWRKKWIKDSSDHLLIAGMRCCRYGAMHGWDPPPSWSTCRMVLVCELKKGMFPVGAALNWLAKCTVHWWIIMWLNHALLIKAMFGCNQLNFSD
jgi:hypothetical protein